MIDLKNIKIKYSDNNTNNNIIYDLLRVEEDVFEEKDRGKYDNVVKRFIKNKEMFVLLYDGDDLIGYLCYFPISKELHDNIIGVKDFYDDNIKEQDVEKYSRENYIYLISIALYTKYQGLGLGKKMMDAFFDDLKERSKKGQHMIDILTSAISLQGESILKKYGFEVLKDMSKKDGYKLMYLKGDIIC